ncbi:MAG: hypothetical protein Q8Q18_02960 [bacterium]|nr:hypothetical protein [bacterium]
MELLFFGGPVQIQDGTEGLDYLLTSDEFGNAHWEDINNLIDTNVPLVTSPPPVPPIENNTPSIEYVSGQSYGLCEMDYYCAPTYNYCEVLEEGPAYCVNPRGVQDACACPSGFSMATVEDLGGQQCAVSYTCVKD